MPTKLNGKTIRLEIEEPGSESAGPENTADMRRKLDAFLKSRGLIRAFNDWSKYKNKK